MANTSPITTSFSVTLSKESSANNVLSLEEYSPKARLDPALPAIGDENYRYAAVYGNHLRNSTGGIAYLMDGYLCYARYLAPGSVSNSVDVVAPKEGTEIAVFSGSDSYDISTAGITSVTDLEIIGKFYKIDGKNILEGSVTVAYDAANARLKISPAGQWYGVVSFKYKAQGDLWLVALDANRLPTDTCYLVASSFWWDESQLKYLPVIAYLEFTGQESQSAQYQIALDEYTPSETSQYYPQVTPTTKFVDLWVDKLESNPQHEVAGSQGVLISAIAYCTKENKDITTFESAESVSASQPGITGATLTPVVLYDATLTKLNPGSVSFSYDSSKGAFVPSPAGTYTGAGIITTSQRGIRHKVDISKTPSMTVTDMDGTVTTKRVAVMTATKVWTDPVKKEPIYGFAEISLDAGSSSTTDSDNQLVVEVLDKKDPRASRVYTNNGDVIVEVFADHPADYIWFVVTGGRNGTPTQSRGETRYTKKTIAEQITINGESSVDFKKPGLAAAPVLKVQVMLTEEGKQVTPELVYNEKSKKITFNPSGKYYGVIQADYSQKCDRYIASLSLEDTNDDTYNDTYLGTFVAYSTWVNPETLQPQPVFVATELSEDYVPLIEASNIVSLESYEKALGFGDAPLSKREKYYAIYGNLSQPYLEHTSGITTYSAGSAYKLVNEIVTFSGSNKAGYPPGFVLTGGPDWVMPPVNEHNVPVSVGIVFNPDTNQIELTGGGINDSSPENTGKYYGLLAIRGYARGELFKVDVDDVTSDSYDVGYAKENQDAGVVYAYSNLRNPETGEPLIAMAHATVSGVGDDKNPEVESPKNPERQTFTFKIEKSELEPATNISTGKTEYYLKIYPYPSLGLSVVDGDGLFKGVQGYRFQNNEVVRTGNSIPKTKFKIRKKTFVNNTSKISLDYLSEGKITASISGAKDVFGHSRDVVVLLPGEKYKSVSWRKDNVRNYMIPEKGTGDAAYQIVGPQELVIATSVNVQATKERYLAEIPVLAELTYEYESSYGTMIATWDHEIPKGPSVVMEMHSGIDKVMHVTGEWLWNSGTRTTRRMLGTGTFTASNQNKVLQRPAKGGSLLPQGGTV